MAKMRRISFEEFATHIQKVFDRIIQEREIVVVDAGDDNVITIHPGENEHAGKNRLPGKTDDDIQAFLASAGSWKDFEVEEFLENVYASRDHGSRPPVNL